MRRFFNFSKRNPHKILVIAIIMTIVMGFGITQVSITEDMEEFLPEDHVSYRVLKEYQDSAGDLITEAIMVEGKDLTSADSFKQIKELTSKLWSHEELEDYISWIRSYPGYLIPRLENEFEDWKGLPNQELEAEIEDLLDKPEIQKDTNIYISGDRTGAVVTLIINNDLSESTLREKTKILHEITDNYDKDLPGFSLSNTGTISTDLAIENGIIRDLLLLIPIAAAFIIIVLYLVFRRLLDTVLPFLVLGLGAVWMIGTMGLLDIPFYANFTIIVPLLLGIGIDYTIHLLNRYYGERSEGRNAEISAINSVGTVGVAIFLTALTTVIGFSSFGISDMPPIKSFGFVAGLGVLYVFLLANTVLPSLLVIRDRGKKVDDGRERSWGQDRTGRVLVRVENAIFNKSKIALVGAALLTILAIFPILNLSTTMSSDIMMPRGAEAVETKNALEGYFRGYGSESKAFILVEGKLSSPATLEAIKNLQESIMSNPRNEGLIMGTSSLTDMVKAENEGQIPQNEERASEIFAQLNSQSDPKYGKIRLSENKTAINISFQTDTMEEEREATEIIRSEIENMAAREDAKIDLMNKGHPAVSGMPVIFSDISNSIKPDLISSILLAIVLVIIVLTIVFKSPLLGVLGALPVSLTLIWELGLLGSLGIPLNVMNMLVSAIIIGIGIDFTIHIVYRFKEEWKKKGRMPREAISKTFQSTGRAILSAAATTIGAFVIISFSSTPMLTSFGWLSAMVIFLSLVGALIILPPMLFHYAKHKNEETRESKKARKFS